MKSLKKYLLYLKCILRYSLNLKGRVKIDIRKCCCRSNFDTHISLEQSFLAIFRRWSFTKLIKRVKLSVYQLLLRKQFDSFFRHDFAT